MKTAEQTFHPTEELALRLRRRVVRSTAMRPRLGSSSMAGRNRARVMAAAMDSS